MRSLVIIDALLLERLIGFEPLEEAGVGGDHQQDQQEEALDDIPDRGGDAHGHEAVGHHLHREGTENNRDRRIDIPGDEHGDEHAHEAIHHDRHGSHGGHVPHFTGEGYIQDRADAEEQAADGEHGEFDLIRVQTYGVRDGLVGPDGPQVMPEGRFVEDDVEDHRSDAQHPEAVRLLAEDRDISGQVDAVGIDYLW